MKLFKSFKGTKLRTNETVFSIVNEEIISCKDSNEIELTEFNNRKFKGCIFRNYIFRNYIFNNCIFEDCIFKSCSFINCKVQFKTLLKFYYCDFSEVNIYECDLNGITIEESNLVKVSFRNTSIEGGLLRGNNYEGVTFKEDCNLMDSIIDDNYKKFDIKFINEKAYTKLNYGTYIGRYNYNKFDKFLEKFDDEKRINLSISNTYMDLGSQFLKNNAVGKYGVCFYEGKKAFHRILTGKRKILSNLYNIVCGYGEKPSRTFTLSLIIIMFFGILYMFTGLKTFSGEVLSVTSIVGSLHITDFLKLIIYSIYFSTVTFATVGYGDIMVVNSAGMIVSIIEIIIGVFMIGIWTSTLVRKMTR